MGPYRPHVLLCPADIRPTNGHFAAPRKFNGLAADPDMPEIGECPAFPTPRMVMTGAIGSRSKPRRARRRRGRRGPAQRPSAGYPAGRCPKCPTSRRSAATSRPGGRALALLPSVSRSNRLARRPRRSPSRARAALFWRLGSVRGALFRPCGVRPGALSVRPPPWPARLLAHLVAPVDDEGFDRIVLGVLVHGYFTHPETGFPRRSARCGAF